MRYLIGLLLALTCLFNAQAQILLGVTTNLRGGGAPAASVEVVCNLTTGVATGTGAGTCIASPATCNGIADDTAAINSFVTWATTVWQPANTGLIQLFIPSGKTCMLNDPGTVTFSGIRKLLVVGYGATLGGNFLHLGGDGQWQNNLHSTRIATVAAGATQVTFAPAAASQPAACNSNATCAALFTVGGYAVIAGVDLQTGVGFPSNPFYFQYLTITNINSSTGVVTFTPPLTDGYKSTWPNYNTGTGVEADPGGPATLYAFKPGWNIEIEWRGITFNQSMNTQSDADGRIVVFRDTTFVDVGQACVYPSQVYSFSIINSTMTNCTMEADKFVQNFALTNTTIDQIGFQNSGSAKSFTMTGSTIRNLVGTPQNMVMSNSTVTGTLRPGPTTNGRADSISITSSSIAAIGSPQDGWPAIGGMIFKGKIGLDEGINNIPGGSMAGGVITIPKAYIASQTQLLGWAAPGNNMCWSDATYTCTQIFRIIDLTDNATNVFITTSLSGGFPTSWTIAGGKLWIGVHPTLQFTCNGCTGDPNAVGLNSAPPGAPLYSYGKRTYTKPDTATQKYWPVWGALSKLNITVNTAFAGAGTVTTTPSELSNSWFSAAVAVVTYTPAIVNLKVAGVRALDASGGIPATWTGSQTGDTLTTLAQALWGPNLFTPSMTDISSDPTNPMSVTIEVQTNPGVVLP